MLYPVPSVGTGENLDDIEAAGAFQPPVALEIKQGHPGESLLLFTIDRLGRPAEGQSATSLDLDENQDVAILGNQIDFAEASAEAPLENPHSRATEQVLRQDLAIDSQLLTWIVGSVVFFH